MRETILFIATLGEFTFGFYLIKRISCILEGKDTFPGIRDSIFFRFK